MFQELIGSAVKVKSTIVVDGGGVPDTVAIDIYHQDGTQVVTAQSMVLADGLWTYVYQSAADAKKGVYKCIIKAVKGSYTDYSKEEFELEDH